jgi:hypothetical protein
MLVTISGITISTEAATYDIERAICSTLSTADLVDLATDRLVHSSYANERGMFPAQVVPVDIVCLAAQDELDHRNGFCSLHGLDSAKRMADHVALDRDLTAFWNS